MQLARAVLLSLSLSSAGLCEAQDIGPALKLPSEIPDYTFARTINGPQRLRPRYSGVCRLGCLPGPLPKRDLRIADHVAQLGRVLFYDKRLSRNRTISCASCHQQARAFADTRPLSRGFLGGETKRNSIAIVNAGGNGGTFFWDGRARTLEQMVLMPIQDPVEMGMDLGKLVDRLQSDIDYLVLFRHAFGDTVVTESRIASALAGFVRSLASFRSKFDAGIWTAGSVQDDFKNFTDRENRGKRIFFGTDQKMMNSCASCHAVSKSKSSMFLFQNYELVNNGVDLGRKCDDPGRAAVTKKSADRGKFRMPSLRNIELTAPYMHDGRFQTLEQVVAFYANRVHAHESIDRRMLARDTATYARILVHDAVGFPLTGRQRKDLVAFLKTLTDWEFVKDPRFSDPFPKSRRVAKR